MQFKTKGKSGISIANSRQSTVPCEGIAHYTCSSIKEYKEFLYYLQYNKLIS